DPTVGKVKWEIKENLAAYGGALATASGIVFYGTMEGWLKAVDATTGTLLWKFKTPSGIIGNPMTYLGPDGKQYVAVLSGVGGWAGAGVALGIGPADPTAALGALGASASVALMASAQSRAPSDLRVCADPYDLPFSNNQEEGFENKIAHLVARDLNATVTNYWWPSRRGVLRNSILGGFCDVMIQAPVGLDPVATTKPYYRSTYYFVYRTDRGFALRSLDDTILKRLKIGVNMIGYDYTNTPPAH